MPSIFVIPYSHFCITMSKDLIVREFNAETDIENVERLEKNCTVGSNKNLSIFCDMMGDPLCRIRFYPVHIMLVCGADSSLLSSCQKNKKKFVKLKSRRASCSLNFSCMILLLGSY